MVSTCSASCTTRLAAARMAPFIAIALAAVTGVRTAVSLASTVAVAAAVIQPSRVFRGYAVRADGDFAAGADPCVSSGEIRCGFVGGCEGGADPPGTGRSGSRLCSVIGGEQGWRAGG